MPWDAGAAQKAAEAARHQARSSREGLPLELWTQGDYSTEIWLRPDLRRQHLKAPMEPDLHGIATAKYGGIYAL